MTAVLDRPSRPAAGVPRPYHFPHFERSALPNGLRLVVAPISKLPLVTITVLADAGAVSEPLERSGLAQLTAKLLLEGTTSADGVAITDRFERLGASIEANADWDVAAVTMRPRGPRRICVGAKEWASFLAPISCRVVKSQTRMPWPFTPASRLESGDTAIQTP